MTDDVALTTVEPMLLAAVRRQLLPGDVAAAWRPALDLVWAFIRREPGLWSGGHNVFVYRAPSRRGAPMIVDFGVQVTRPFDGDGDVQPTQTPGGRAATVRHVGPIDGLRAAWDAVEAWRAERGERFAGVSWETYGDWGDDPATYETWVIQLLA